MRGERVVTSWRSVCNLHDTVLVNHTYVMASHWIVCERCAIIRKQKKIRYPQGLILRNFSWEWSLPISWWILKNQENTFSVKKRAASLNLISPLSLLKMLIKHYVRPAAIDHQGWGGEEFSFFFFKGETQLFRWERRGDQSGSTGFKGRTRGNWKLTKRGGGVIKIL